MTFARGLRISVLLLVLLAVAQGAYLARARTTEWREPLRVVIYPVNADGSAATGAYLDILRRDSYEPIEVYLREQAAVHGLALRKPVEIYLAPRVASQPPAAPSHASAIEAIVFSLKLRFWAWRNERYEGPKAHVRMFVLYFEPAEDRRLQHSLGLQKGMIGVVYAFAAERMAADNNVVIVHELLHTFGATDKYDPRTNQPLYPGGYADPDARPTLPQSRAEIMGGRIPLSATRAAQAQDLSETVIGAQTAREINWVR